MSKKKPIFLSLILTFSLYLMTMSGTVAFSQNNTYTELPNPQNPNPQLWKNITGTAVSWGSIDVRYKKEQPANEIRTNRLSKNIVLKAWRGERVNAQFVVSNQQEDIDLSYMVHPIVEKNNPAKILLEKEAIYTGFVRYVMTDGLNKNGKGTCGYRDSRNFDSTLVADPIDHHRMHIRMHPMQTQAVWIGVDVPRTSVAGHYQTQVDIMANGQKIDQLTLNIEVIEATLPTPQNQQFHLDLWQNPYAVARYYNVPLWSKSHFEHLKEELKLYADAGGKVITASIIEKPWNGQTYDPFGEMIKWIKKEDGSWEYDFSIFDKWVTFMMSIGIDQQINCYSMIPWKESFKYFDQKTGQYQYLKASPNTLAYKQHWTPFLIAFAQHLKTKKWFHKTYISMDERPMEKMLATLRVIKTAVPDFKVSLAGALHDELIDQLDDYCVALRMKFTPTQIKKRKEKKQITTFYTSCEEAYPNTYTFSTPADSEWFAWYAAKAGLDGYLRWALNSWVHFPLQDSRFTAWGAGDAYLIYPGGRSSIRYERLKMGIQHFEKIQILKAQYQENEAWSKLYLLEKLLSGFDDKKLTQTNAANIIQRAKQSLYRLIDNKEEVITEALIDQLDIAKSIKTQQYPIGNEPNQYDLQKWEILQMTISQATDLIQNPQKTQKQIDELLKNLISATTSFKNSINPPFAYSTDQKTYWYQIVDRRTPKSYMYMVQKDVLDNQLKWTTQNNPNNHNQLFKFVQKDENSFYFYNKANTSHPVSVAKADASIIVVGENSKKDTWKIIPTQFKDYYLIQLANGDEAMQLNSYRSHNDKIGFWGPAPDDMGNQWKFVQHSIQAVEDNYTKTTQLFSVIDKHIVPHQVDLAYTLYSITGETISPNTTLTEGIYIVKIDANGETIKIIVD